MSQPAPTVAAPTPPPPPQAPAETEAKDGNAPRRRVHPTPTTEIRPERAYIRPFFRLRKMGVLNSLADEWKKQGDVFRARLGPISPVIVCHPDGIERILAGHLDNYVKGSIYTGARSVLGNGLITSVGTQWRKRRTLMQPRFHRAALAGLVDSMAERSVAFFDQLQPGEIDGHHAMIDITLDIVVSSLFGTPDRVDIDYDLLGEMLVALSERSNSFQLPLSIPTPSNLRFKRVMSALDDTVKNIISAARKDPNPATLLHMLMTSEDAETGKPISDADIRDEIVTLFVAGHETTALTLTWMFVLLEQHPEIVDAMTREVDEVLQGKTPGLEDLPQLDLLRRVTEETLRMRGPVAMVARNVVEDDNILGFKVKKGDIVLPFFYALHRHPDFWPDPDRFDPSRFTEDAKKGRDLWSYVPFSSGQRVCIGNHFALFEAQVILATMLQRFHFAAVPGQVIEPDMQTTVRPSTRVRVKFTRRTNAPALT